MCVREGGLLVVEAPDCPTHETEDPGVVLARAEVGEDEDAARRREEVGGGGRRREKA